jgi:hypothetical protein
VGGCVGWVGDWKRGKGWLVSQGLGARPRPTHAHTHARTHASTHPRKHAPTHVSTHARTHARTHASTHPHTSGHTHARTHARSLARTHTHIPHSTLDTPTMQHRIYTLQDSCSTTHATGHTHTAPIHMHTEIPRSSNDEDAPQNAMHDTMRHNTMQHNV